MVVMMVVMMGGSSGGDDGGGGSDGGGDGGSGGDDGGGGSDDDDGGDSDGGGGGRGSDGSGMFIGSIAIEAVLVKAFCFLGYIVCLAFFAVQNELFKLEELAIEQRAEEAAEERTQAIIKNRCKRLLHYCVVN